MTSVKKEKDCLIESIERPSRRVERSKEVISFRLVRKDRTAWGAAADCEGCELDSLNVLLSDRHDPL